MGEDNLQNGEQMIKGLHPEFTNNLYNSLKRQLGLKNSQRTQKDIFPAIYKWLIKTLDILNIVGHQNMQDTCRIL